VLFVQHLLNGLLAGAYYLLIALGLSLIFSLGGIVNLAHGAFYAIGAYLAVSIGARSAFPGRPCFRRSPSACSAWSSRGCSFAASTRPIRRCRCC
jgi:branched-subunit amino acid ABC-type transport system permease component